MACSIAILSIRLRACLKIKKAKKTNKMKMNKKSVYELDDEESHDPDYDNNRDEIIEKVFTLDKRKKWFGIVTWSSPKQLYTAIKSLNKRQRGLVRSMGFGGIDISALTEANECTKFFSKWRQRYGRRRISPEEIVNNISNDKYEDYIVFKLDFLVLFLTTVDCWRNGLCKYALIERLDLEVDLKDYDWCGYVVDAIKRGKEGWKRCTRSPLFVGPLTILTLLYIDHVSCQGINENREVSAIEFWSFENLQKREGIEIKESGFGLGEIIEHFVEEVNYEMESKEPLLEGDNNNDDDVGTVNKFDENTIKGHRSMLSSIYSRIMKDNKAFAKAIIKTRSIFPDDMIVAEFVNKYDEVYIEELEFDDYILLKRETNSKSASVEHGETPISSKETTVDMLEDSSAFEGKRVESEKCKLNLEEVPTFSLGLTQEAHKVDTYGDLTQEMLDATVEIEKLYGLKNWLAKILQMIRKEVLNDVVDCWAAVLNFEEKNRSPSSLRRLFCPTTPFYGWVLENSDETDESRYSFLETHLHVVLEGHEKLYDLKQFDVILFPIFEKRHSYLMSFDPKNPSIRLIDNMHPSQYVNIYKDRVIKEPDELDGATTN
ncbi:hypothetical protein R6Q57_019832 [Mikania cordata]